MSPDHWAVSAGLVAISALALIANAILLLVFFRRRGLRTVSNRFVINLLITNLLSSIIIIPLLLVDQELEPRYVTHQNVVLGETNNTSSKFIIENIQLKLDEIKTTIAMSESTTSQPEDTEGTVMDEDAPVKIRHLKHLLRLENVTFEASKSWSNETDAYSGATTFLCYLSGGSTTLVCTASILSILLIAIDQYFAVTHPLRYHAFIDKFKSSMLLVSTWFISLVFGMLGAFVQTDASVWNFCSDGLKKSDFQTGYNIFYAFTYFILIILVPFIVICVLYSCIYCAAHKNSERMRKSNSGSSSTNLDTYIQIPLVENSLKVKVNSSDNLNASSKDVPRLPKVKSAPNFANLEKIRLNNLPITRLASDVKINHANSLRSNASFINCLRTKISNASLFRYREETRAAKISILVIFMVLVCYVPFGLTLIMNTNLITQISPNHFNSVSLSLLVVANLLSPFLFAYRNRRIKRELRKLLGFVPKRNARDLSVVRERNSCVYRPNELRELENKEPFLQQGEVPEVVVTCKGENEKKSILKRVCSKGKTWGVVKKCNFISVPECLSVECRCSFSSASTQVSSEEYSACH